MLKNVADITSQGKGTGLNTQDNILGIDKSQSPNMMNVRVHFDGSLEKRLGSNTQNTVIIASSAGPGFNPVGSLTANLQAFWRMDEASGDRYDSFGNNILRDVNAVPSDGGIKNKSSLFVASNTSYLILENTATIATGDVDFSISSWIYLNSTSPTVQRAIVSKRDIVVGGNNPDQQTSSTTTREVGSNQAASLKGAGQTFTASASYTITGFILKLSKTGSPTGDIKANLYTISGGVPTGSPIASSSTFDVSTLTGSATDTTFTFVTPIAITSGTSYAITIETEANYVGDGSNRIDMGIDTSNPYSGGSEILKDSGSSWSSISGEDCYFKTTKSTSVSQFEYFLYINTNNIATFEVSSSGVSQTGQVSATSFGALGTATWYNVVGYHDAGNNLLAVGVNLSMNSASYSLGVLSGSAPFVVGAVSNGAGNFFDGRIDETGFWKKALTTQDRIDLYNAGSSNTYQTAFDTQPWASFDFGASSIRWLTVSAGTGVYASSNLGLSWITIATDRTANYQFFERSKNVLIATSDSYNTPLAWPGSSGTFMMMLNNSAPLCKYSINFQGFLILLNSNLRKRGFFYQDENTQLTGAWSSSFDIPSTQDDEITASFILRRYLYVSTKYYLYRVSYVGGNPDFSYLKVKDWGYVQRTVRYIYVEGIGQIVAGLCWDGKIRLFDGSDDQILSTPVEQNNGLCEFALNDLSYSGSGPVISFAETDYNENVYKLVVAIGAQSTKTTHMLNFDGRSKSFYPYDKQFFNTMVMAESGNRRFLMAFDRSGYCHMMDSGNLDGNSTPINDHYDGSIVYEKSPAQVHKGHQTHLFFNNTSAGNVYYSDAINFETELKQRNVFSLDGANTKFHHHEQVDVPEEYNTYRWSISSSSGTANPWKLKRYDHFTKGLGIGRNE